MDSELNRATEIIERMQQEINTLQDEVARLTIRREEGSGDIAARLVAEVLLEKAKEQMRKTPDRILTIDPNVDFHMTIHETRYTVSVRENGPAPKKRSRRSLSA